MDKVKSNHLKCRNLPCDTEYVDRISSKPVSGLLAVAIIGISCLGSEYVALGLLMIFLSVYGFMHIKDHCMVGFTDNYVIFFMDDRGEDCYLIYWDEIKDYRYIRKPFETDFIQITLIDGTSVSFKSLSRPTLLKNFKKYVPLKQTILDEE